MINLYREMIYIGLGFDVSVHGQLIIAYVLWEQTMVGVCGGANCSPYLMTGK
jgi:hypothetical protein